MRIRRSSCEDEIYVIREAEPEHGDVYLCKIGITSSRLNGRRLREHFTTHFSAPKVVFHGEVPDARSVERNLLKKHTNRPEVSTKSDGYSELRLINGPEIAAIKNELIDMMVL